jgi:GDSL-like Lipase/Acylhydrolase family
MARSDDKSVAGPVAEPSRSRLRTFVFYLVIVLVNVAILEVFLRVADFALLRVTLDSRVPYDHDPELGWAPVANEHSARGNTNSLGLADIELAANDKPVILFLGDSLAHGIGVEPAERFTDRLREKLPGFRVLNAGVVGYGTDQEYLLMQRLWPKVEPKVVVLIVCVLNDHGDNSSNSRYGHTLKPYLENVGGAWVFRGQPVPVSARWYFYNNWFANHSAIVRSVIVLYTRLRHPPVMLPDPTEQLITMVRDFVESRGARFLVGLQLDDPKLEPFLQAQKIPYARLAGAATLSNGTHWNPEGHKTVAERLKDLFAAEHVLESGKP